MTVKEKIQIKNGYISKPEAMDHSLKIKTQNLLWEYNNTRPDENEKRSTILQELFGTCSPLTFIEPNFKCDYGFNIHTKGLAVINYNCVMLDTSPIHIGENAFIGSISFDYIVSATDVTKTYSSSYQLFFVKNSYGKWRMTNLCILSDNSAKEEAN